MSDNIFGTTPTSTLISVAEVALKVMQGKSPIKEDWFKDEAEDVQHKWKRMNTKLRVKWLAQIKVMAKKEDMSQEELDDRLDDYGLVKFPREKVWDEAEKIKPKWKKMSTSARIKWLDDLDVIAKKTHTSHADVQSILDDAKLKKEEVELDEGSWWKKKIRSVIWKEYFTDYSKSELKVISQLIKMNTDGVDGIVGMMNDDPKEFKRNVQFLAMTQFLTKEEVELDEATPMYPPTIKNLRMIVKDKQNQVFMFKVGKARVDLFTASAIIAVYDGLKKPEHKKKLEDMIKTKEGFLKTQAFAMKMVK